MEAEVHCLDTGNRIQVDIAMQAADEEKVDEQKKKLRRLVNRWREVGLLGCGH